MGTILRFLELLSCISYASPIHQSIGQTYTFKQTSVRSPVGSLHGMHYGWLVAY
jgi:hypothetical protein